MHKATAGIALGGLLGACGGNGFIVDAGVDARTSHTDVFRGEVSGEAACMRVEGWNNVAAADCSTCAMTACAAEYAAYAGEGGCPREIQSCASGCGGPTDCTCRAACVTATFMDDACVAAWGAYDDCVANACDDACR